MKIVSWFKGLGFVAKLAANWQAYALIATTVVATAGGAYIWHGLAVDGAHDEAFAAGRLEVENDVIREQQRELARMVGITNTLNEAYREQIKTIDSAQARIAADADRMRQLKAQRAAAIAAASPEAVRGYATTAGDVYAACRDEYRALGFDAERCSAAAHAVNDWAKALTREDIDATRATLRKTPE